MMTLFCLVRGGRAGAGKGGNFQVGESGGQRGSGGSSKAGGAWPPPVIAAATPPQQDIFVSYGSSGGSRVD